MLVPAAHGAAWLDLISHADMQIVPDAGHWLRDHETEALRWCGDKVSRSEVAP